MLDAYAEGRIDRLFIATQRVRQYDVAAPGDPQLLPLEASGADEELKHRWDYLYEPDARELIDGLVTRFIESQVYQCGDREPRVRAGREDDRDEERDGKRGRR